LVSLVTDQVPKNDISRTLQRKHGFFLAKTVEEAITLGTDKVAVAGVLSIGEHGNYPTTKDTGQHMYPRRRFFDAIVAAFKKYGQVVPVFNDKHLAYNWADAKHMYHPARELKIPFMAGSPRQKARQADRQRRGLLPHRVSRRSPRRGADERPRGLRAFLHRGEAQGRSQAASHSLRDARRQALWPLRPPLAGDRAHDPHA